MAMIRASTYAGRNCLDFIDIFIDNMRKWDQSFTMDTFYSISVLDTQFKYAQKAWEER